MKDYYQILGLEPSATQEEIKKAYKKLAFKFHPDRNQGDLFFENMFRQVKEAYDTLGDAQSRVAYDLKLKGGGGAYVSDPVITQFAADKSQIYPGDTVTFFWNVENADTVQLHPFGPVASFGQASYRLKNIAGPTLEVSITAYNRSSGRSVQRTIILHNLTSHRQSRQSAQAQSPYLRRPPNYLLLGILATVLCVQPLGIISIIYSLITNYRWKRENYKGAWSASAAARNWALVAIVISIFFYVIGKI